MKTLGGRSSRVLLVAAMSTTAFMGGTATAGAAETHDPASPDCHDPADTPPALSALVVGDSGCDQGLLMARSLLAGTMRSHASLQAAETPVLKAFDVLHPNLGLCDTPPAARAGSADPAKSPRSLEAVTGTDLAAVVGTTIQDAEPVDVLAPETPLTVDGLGETAAVDTAATAETTASRSADTGVASAVGGVVVEETIVEVHTVAPDRMEVVGPATAATGGLPDTGYDGSILTMLGLAMIASGAAARYVARD